MDFIDYDKVEEYRNFGGIRNEEDYLVTETGARRLGKKIPLTPEEVEYLEELYVPHPLTSVVRPSVEAKK